MKVSSQFVKYTGLVVATGLALFFFWRSEQYQTKMINARESMQKAKETNTWYRQLASADSLLASGHLEEAKRSYQSLGQVNDTIQQSHLQWRLALVSDLIRKDAENKRNASSNTGGNEDSLASGTNRLLAPSVYDSLTFALKKAQAQLEHVQRQLKQKSFGEYLTFTSSKGNEVQYVGQVKNGKAHGLGVAIFDTGSRYRGEWVQNQRHGKGAFYWQDGEYYEGEYKNDRRSGQGTYYWPNGERYVGAWKNDRRNGQGIFYGKDGEIVARGIWKNDELVEVEK